MMKTSEIAVFIHSSLI